MSLGPTHVKLVPSYNGQSPHRKLGLKVPYRQRPFVIQSADARAACSEPMWPLTVSVLQWGQSSLKRWSWTHKVPVHTARKEYKKKQH